MTLRTVTPENARRLLSEGAILLDIRETDEHAREHITGAHHLPLSKLDEAESALHDGKPVIFYCRSGARTLANAERLAVRTGGSCEAYVIEGGLDAWRTAGLPVVTDRRQPIELQRQVQIGAGGMAMSGTLLGVLVSPWFFRRAGVRWCWSPRGRSHRILRNGAPLNAGALEPCRGPSTGCLNRALQSRFEEVFAMTKLIVLAATATLILSGSASAQDSGQKQLSNCHPSSSAAPGETSGSASRQGPWDSQAVEKSAILPSVGEDTTSAASTVQRHGQSVEARSDCPPELSTPKVGGHNR